MARFAEVFGSLPTVDSPGDALVAFQLSTFSAVNLDDQGSLNAQQQLGKRVFFGKACCGGCHAGPNFSDESLS